MWLLQISTNKVVKTEEEKNICVFAINSTKNQTNNDDFSIKLFNIKIQTLFPKYREPHSILLLLLLKGKQKIIPNDLLFSI